MLSKQGLPYRNLPSQAPIPPPLENSLGESGLICEGGDSRVIFGYLGMGGRALPAEKSEECKGKDDLST